MKKITVSQPYLDSAETEAVNAALRGGELSGNFGSFIGEFERKFADYCGCPHAVTVSNGTTALHLPLAALGVKQGDEVLVSTLTNMATFFAVLYQGAVPVPVDIEPDTLNMDPALLEALVTPRTRAILVVHLFGHPVDMDPVLAVARKHNLLVLEDCAEAHGALYKGRKVGSLSDAGCFSFYANKIITTGEGGMVTCADAALAAKMRSLKALAFGDTLKFMHKDLGYNYRLTNLQAAIGCAQAGKIDEVIAHKRRIAAYYTSKLSALPELQLPVEKPYARSVFWMYHIVLKGKTVEQRAAAMKFMAGKGIEVREGFIPYNLQEIFIARGLTQKDACPVANSVAYNSFYLPSGPVLSEEDMDYVVASLKEALAQR
ncbi:MAG TPA: DegT/DnrJ/EryC1/StrS family aminotransferase [Elusimicrobia bacterium]|nr:MAG: glutamine--scyllo-inositol aminotransferase [Elusimicrobia bacterium GWD2_63_28]HCC47989.1 DegT/DnrJ/EryC1/StrS family aminotransferase [Elusimicrobiota bacterium]